MSQAIDRLVRSGMFPDKTSAANALGMYSNLKKPFCKPLISAVTGKKYTTRNFQEYLEDFCKVEWMNLGRAMQLVIELSD